MRKGCRVMKKVDKRESKGLRVHSLKDTESVNYGVKAGRSKFMVRHQDST